MLISCTFYSLQFNTITFNNLVISEEQNDLSFLKLTLSQIKISNMTVDEL